MAEEAFNRLGQPIPPTQGPSQAVNVDGVQMNPDILSAEISPEIGVRISGFINSLGLNQENAATAKEFIKTLCRHTSYVRGKINRLHSPNGPMSALYSRVMDLTLCVQNLRQISQQNTSLLRDLSGQLQLVAQQRFENVLQAPAPITKTMDSRFKGITVKFSANEASASRVSKMLMHSTCLLYTSPSPRDGLLSRMPSSA